MCSSNAVHYIGFTLGGGYAHFELSFVLGNELWEEHFESFLFTKEFTLGRKENVGYMAMCVTNNFILGLQPGFAEGGIVPGRFISLAQVSCILVHVYV